MKRIFLSLAGFVTMFSMAPALVQSRVPTTPSLQTQARPEAKTFTGTILKSGESFFLSDSVTKSRYMLDDQDKARPLEGKSVNVTGTIDVARDTIHVQTIEEIV